MRMLFGCFVGSEPSSSATGSSGSESGDERKAVRRMRSATARLRSLSLDELSRALASSGLHAFTEAELSAARGASAAATSSARAGSDPSTWGTSTSGSGPAARSSRSTSPKYLDADGPQGHREWLAEVVYLGMLKHPHLVKLVGYGCQDEQRMLVYEYMERGSLEHHLFKSKLLSICCRPCVVHAAEDRDGRGEGAGVPARGRHARHLPRLQGLQHPARHRLHGKALRLWPRQGGPTGRRHPRHHPCHGDTRLRRARVHSHRAPDGEERRVQLRRGAAVGAAQRGQAAARAGAAPGGLGAPVPAPPGAAAPGDGPQPGRPALRQGRAQGRHARLPLPAQRAQVPPHHARRRRRARAAARHVQRRVRGPLRVHGPARVRRRQEGRRRGGGGRHRGVGQCLKSAVHANQRYASSMAGHGSSSPKQSGDRGA